MEFKGFDFAEFKVTRQPCLVITITIDNKYNSISLTEEEWDALYKKVKEVFKEENKLKINKDGNK
jgi:hypothetical protein